VSKRRRDNDMSSMTFTSLCLDLDVLVFGGGPSVHPG
jgi:hypothetical protein